jgi:diadenosine tetraphosphate (Ap4A) HIT family hydrolase
VPEPNNLPKEPCVICAGTWPQSDHLIVEFGLTTAYLFQDQFFPGWTVLVLKEHVCELFELTQDVRRKLIEEVACVAQALAQTFDAKKINYELLGNQVPHIHWHLIPRLKTDPDPLKPVWNVPHDPVVLSPDQLVERLRHLRSALGFFPD